MGQGEIAWSWAVWEGMGRDGMDVMGFDEKGIVVVVAPLSCRDWVPCSQPGKEGVVPHNSAGIASPAGCREARGRRALEPEVVTPSLQRGRCTQRSNGVVGLALPGVVALSTAG